jgi:hypothetical protein
VFTVDSHVEDESRTTRVRILQAYWGMAVTLTARATTGPEDGIRADGDRADGVVTIAPGLFLDVGGVALGEPEVRALTRGLHLMSRAFPVGTGSHTVRIQHLSWPVGDYQPDVTTIAMAHWAAEHLQVDAPRFEVVYDRATDRYWVSP